VELQKKVNNLETTLHLEGRLESQLEADRQEASFIIKLNKEGLMRKNLEDLYGGEPQGFQVLFNAMEMFMDEIIAAEEEPQREGKTATNYLQSKVQWTAEEKRAGEGKPAAKEKQVEKEKLVGEKPGVREVLVILPS
jgi:hypothetical protein